MIRGLKSFSINKTRGFLAGSLTFKNTCIDYGDAPDFPGVLPVQNITTITHLKQERVLYLLVTLSTALVKALSEADWNRGGRRPRKSAPTRLKDKPKYMHWPSSESSRPPTPRSKSHSRVLRNWETWRYNSIAVAIEW